MPDTTSGNPEARAQKPQPKTGPRERDPAQVLLDRVMALLSCVSAADFRMARRQVAKIADEIDRIEAEAESVTL